MKNCPTCYHPIEDNVKSCNNCGLIFDLEAIETKPIKIPEDINSFKTGDILVMRVTGQLCQVVHGPLYYKHRKEGSGRDGWFYEVRLATTTSRTKTHFIGQDEDIEFNAYSKVVVREFELDWPPKSEEVIQSENIIQSEDIIQVDRYRYIRE